MKEVLNVGMLGFGFIGKVHAYGYQNLPLFYDPLPCRTQITHICDSRPEIAAKGKELLGAQASVTDFREITENPAIDIVNICTPNKFHKEELLSAIAHNKHIYCEKPLAANLAEAEEIQAAAGNYSGTFRMTLQNRFFPATMRAKQLIGEGFLGEVLEFRAVYLHSGSVDPQTPLKWKLSAAYGAGVLQDLASHILDLIHYLLGDYAEIMAETKVAYPQRPSAADPGVMEKVETEDCVMLLAKMNNGALGVIEASKLASGTEDELTFEIHGNKGALRFNCMAPHYLEAYDCGKPGKPIGGSRGWTRIDCGQRYPAPASGFPTPKAALGWLRTHMASLHYFLADVAAGKPGDPGLAQGIYVQKLIERARQSAAERRWLSID